MTSRFVNKNALIMLPLLLFIVPLVFSVSCSLFVAFAQSYSVYRNPSAGIEMLYPSNWKYLPAHIDNKSFLIIFKPRVYNNSNSINAYLKVSINNTNSTLGEFTNNMITIIQNTPGTKVMPVHDKYSLAGSPAEGIEGQYVIQNHFFYVFDTWTVQHGKTFRITFYLPPPFFYLPQRLENVLNTFNITK